MKGKGAKFDESQLRCMSARITSNRTTPAVETLPVDVLLFFNSAQFRSSSNCKTFFKLIGKSNIDILRKESRRRRNLLYDARTCLRISGRNLTKESVTILGKLVCDLEGSIIAESDFSILDALKTCRSYREDQKRAIESRLKNGASRYGVPSSWSSSTIQDLGNLPLTLTDTWTLVNRVVLLEALPRFIKKAKRSRPPYDILVFINQLNLRRSNNTANCTEGLIAAEDINDLTPAIYGPSQLDLCLGDRVLKDNVLQLGALAFNPTQLEVLKKRLLKIYPSGLPENQIQLLGNVSTVFNVTEVSSWNITRIETLSALMKQQLDNTMIKSIVRRYLQLGGDLNAVSLKSIGGASLCTLDEQQLLTISNLTDAGSLDLSTCTQSKKDLLYQLAFSALRSQQSDPIPYFQLIKAYIGGAAADDLKFLANNSINMDFDTFRGLNPEEVRKLTSQDLMNLLGIYLRDLQRGVNETVVVVWVASHTESEVRRLGLTGGIPDNSSEPRPTDRPVNATVNETTLCRAVNSSTLNNLLLSVNKTQLCNFNIKDYACARTDLLRSGLSSDALTSIFQCFVGPKALNRSDELALTTFVQKLNRSTLNEALDIFNNKTLNTSSIPLMTKITFVNALWEIVKTNENLTDPDFLRKWFQERFRPFIAGISQSVLYRLLMRNITCDGYQAVTKGLSNGFSDMPRGTRETVLRIWILGYLNASEFPLRCYENNSFVLYVDVNFQRFGELLTLSEAFSLLPSNRVAEVLDVTDPSDLAGALSRPGFINDNNILTAVLLHIQPIQNLATFVDEFNRQTQDNLPAANRVAIIEGLWPQFINSLPVLNDTEKNAWLNVRLSPYLPFITTRLLFSNNTLRVGCLSYRKIVRTLSARYRSLTSNKQKEIYNGIKAYLQQGPKPKCYDVNDPVLNSTAWFAQYLGLYMNQISLSDLQSFFDNETQLQEFLVDPENLALLENLTLSTEVSKFYLQLLLANNPNVNVSRLPNSLVCFITDTDLLQSLDTQQVLSIAAVINRVCGLNVLPNTTSNGTAPAEDPTDEQLRSSIAIVSKIDNFTVSTLNTLGQTAVGLSVSQVGNIDGETLQNALPSLGKVRGWNVGQANAIVIRLLRNGFQVGNADNLLGLGSLVSGIPSGVFQDINPRVFINVISNPTFVENIGTAPQSIQTICVLQVLRNVEDPVQTVKNIPSVLAKEVPPVLLNSNLSLSDVNDKQWAPSQAAVFFENVVRSSNNFKEFSPSVLQGFSCGAVKELNFTAFLQLVQAMKGKGAKFDESQLRCMSARLTSNRTTPAIETLPVDVLLFFNSAQFRSSFNCQTFFKLVGKSNIDVLRKGSRRRRNLLYDAMTCLGISGRNLTKESVTILGKLVCDLDGSIIAESDISILDALKICRSYSEDQKRAIEGRLKSGASRYGVPSSWSSSTIQDLGNLPLTLTDTWTLINRVVLLEALPRFIKKAKRSRPPYDILVFINQLNLRRSNNTANCTEGLIAAEDINDLTPAIYGPSQLDLCLGDRVLKDNVLQLGALAFNPTQLEVLKKRLLKIYPSGLRENQIQLLGNISTVFNVTEVSSWNITRVETLSALMKQQLDNITVKSIVTRYLQLDGVLNTVSLKAIGGPSLCTLDKMQLLTISNLTDAGALDLTACTQLKKDLFYQRAFSELRSQQSDPIPYFQLIKAYIAGAPADDLKSLANNRINMDFETFKGLNPGEVKKLTSQDLINLLGINLQDLQRGVNETVVVIWVASHTESEVRRLGLTGGIPDNSSEPRPDDRPGNTTVNETTLCTGVNSSALNNFLIEVNKTQLCNFNIKVYACARTDLLLSGLSSDTLTDVFGCLIDLKPLKRSDEVALTVFLQKLDRTTLNDALDKFSSKTLNTSSIPLMTKITFTNALWEIVKTNENLTDPDFLRKWFQERFRPFIAGISQSVLYRLLMRNITCDGYQAVIKGLNNGFSEMPQETRTTVLRVWIFGYLNSTGAACIANTNGSRDWLLKNWGRFGQLVQIDDLTRLNPDFNALDAADLLTPSQLGEFAAKNRTLTNVEDVERLFNSITSATVTEFIEKFRTAANQNNVVFTPSVRLALLRGVLDRAQPILSNASSGEIQIWFGMRLQVLLPGLTANIVPLVFATESCNGSQIIVSTLSSIKQQLTASVQETIFRNILAYTKEIPLRCYENNSFSLYLNSQFGNFSEFLTLSDVLSLVPSNRTAEVFNTADPSDFADLFSRPGFIDDNDILKMVLMNYQPIQNLATFVDQFNLRTRDMNLTDANHAAIIQGLWPQFVNSLSILNDTEQDAWLNVRLSPYLSFITTDLLVSNSTLKVQCLPYRRIVRTLSARYSDFTSNKQNEIYNGIKVYLQQEPKPKCYNMNDPVLNSTAWFAEYLGLFMNNVTATDLQSFTSNASILRDFAANPENLQLLNNLTLPTEISRLYATFLLNNNPNIDILSLPDSIICFTAGTDVLESLSGEQTLSIIERVNQVCGFSASSNETLSQTTNEQIKLSKSLVSRIDNFSASTLNNLQQTAVGLSVSQIEETDANNFKESLTTLRNVRGWNRGQANTIVSKLSTSGVEFRNTNNLLQLGTLVQGVPSRVFEIIEPAVLVNVTSNPTFVRNILVAPQPSQQIIVLKVLQTETNPLRRVQKIPSELVQEIPPVHLTADLNLNDVNNKQWVPEQASVFFENIVRKNNNYIRFSPSILQGFSCGAVRNLNSVAFLQLVQAMKGRGVVLDESQLSCMSYRLTSTETPLVIDTLPEDVLLFFDSTEFRSSANCKSFFRAIGRSNINILQKGSRRRQRLLNGALTCLGVGSGGLTRESVTVLGDLTCDLEGSVIENCDITILDTLRNCNSYSEDQMIAIENLLSTRATRFGPPTSWTSRTVLELGNLPLTLTSTWNQVNSLVFSEALPRYIRKLKRFRRPRDVVRFLKQLRRRRRRARRATDCTEGQIMPETINELIPVKYDAAQLEACLSNALLKGNVEQLGALDFDSDQLQVLKNKLSQIYPSGLPENQIILLGNISTVFNATEVSSWNITQVETLAALMMQQLENTTVKSIITRYLQLGGTLNEVSLKAIGGPNLCTLDESQLMTISNLTNAGALDISTCTQSKKNLLYNQAASELISQQNNTIAYFNLIKSYLDGARASDLEFLANNDVNMDFPTFIKLNPEEVAKLSAAQLIDLLQVNLPALQTGANETVVSVWVSSHFESEVRRVGLTGGIPDPSSDPQFNFMCGNTTFNETDACAAVNSSAVNSFLMSVNSSQLCNFNIAEYACAQGNLLLAGLTSDHLTSIFNCFTTSKTLKNRDEIALGVFVQKLDKTTLNEALDKFNNMTFSTSSIPLMTKITFMNVLWEIVKTSGNLTIVDFLTKWFQERFRPFLAGIPKSVLSCLLIRNTTCEGYQAVIKGLNNEFSVMPQATRDTVLNMWILIYLDTTGAGCITNTNGSRDWLLKNWGRFGQLVQIKDLTMLNSNFSGFDVLDLLTPRQLSELTVNSNTLSNAVNINKILDTLSNRHFSELSAYMNHFVNDTQTMGILAIQNETVRDLMLTRILQLLRPHFPQFKTTDYADWFQTNLLLLLPSIKADDLALIPTSISCESNQAIVKGLDKVFTKLTTSQITNVYKLISKYLLKQLNSTGFACTVNITGSRDWLLKNFGRFRSQADYSKLISLNSDFKGLDVVDLLTVRQLAQLSASNGTLKDSQDVKKVMNIITDVTITQFMDIFSFEAKQNSVTLDPEVRSALLSEVLTRAEPIISSSNETELETWLGTRLQLLIPALNRNLVDLILTNTSCRGAQIIIRTLNARISEFTTDVQQQLYNGIRTYLRKGPKPRCYNVNDPALNSTAWFANYFGKFLKYTSIGDLTMLTDNATLQIFAANQENLILLNSIELPEDVQRFYANALFKNIAFNASSVPDSLVCFIVGTPTVQSLTAQQAEIVLKKANRACQNLSANRTTPTDEQLQFAVSLVSKIDSFTPETLRNLGQSAAGLSTTQINNISDNDILESLDSLSKVNGWTTGSVFALVRKLINTRFQVNNATNLLKMGTLVSGLSSDEITNVNNSVLVTAVKDSTFVENILLAPEPVQVLLVQKVISSSNNPTTAIQRVPDQLASKIFLPRLISKDISLPLVNNKQWKPEQAAVFFGTLVENSTINFDDVSASVLQGFSCAAGNILSSNQFLKFAQATKSKTSLSQDQLICMARRLNSSGTPGKISDLPEDVLLFYGPETFPNESCESYFRVVGRANINILPQGSARRQNLLRNAQACLKFSNVNLSKDNVTILNNLTCDYEGDIKTADVSILETLKNCVNYTSSRRDAIDFLLNQNTTFGDPTTWTESTLENLGSLVFAVKRSTWNKVSKNVILKGLQRYVRRQSRYQLQQKQNLLSELFLHTRSRRATECTNGQITADKIFDVILPAQYSAADLDACLDNNILKDRLSQLGTLAFSTEQLQVLKNKLSQIYPNGLPEEKIQLLGIIAVVYNSTEISTWNITKVETVSAVLPNSQNDITRKAVVSTYLKAGGVLNASILNMIGGSVLCLLDESQIQAISSTEISNASTLNISSCSQSKKKIIYNKIKSIIEKQTNDSVIYYNQIKTYLAGATTSDLRTLAKTTTNMDPSVFLTLNPEEVKALSPGNLRNLLGVNLQTVKDAENSTLVQKWIEQHTVSEVQSLKIGLTGGNPDIIPPDLISIQEIGSSSSSINKNCLLCTIQSLSISIIIIILQRWL
ncbi:uncharacterized protein LOC109913006 [Rhincodon typus]|uniref:uncharacterized protein LOC109913006 n=1 Tax=Rhincodon typus TaxID=259920 RepID=UPI00202E9D16|nr:uncharacterized protein LOC109913006 [Rhincodon typus]